MTSGAVGADEGTTRGRCREQIRTAEDMASSSGTCGRLRPGCADHGYDGRARPDPAGGVGTFGPGPDGRHRAARRGWPVRAGPAPTDRPGEPSTGDQRDPHARVVVGG